MNFTINYHLRVSNNGRFLLDRDGKPFFYLADTAWELFHRCNREEAERYLQTRADQGFSVIYAVALAEEDGLHTPNSYGECPLFDDDPARPNSAYFDHVDWIVARAGELGLTIGFLPTWGDKWNKGQWGAGPEVLTPENALAYGRFLGERYREAPLFWILGGDRLIENERHLSITRAMSQGLKEGGSAHLQTFHAPGVHSSSEWLHDEEWLDFNVWQTGHGRNSPNFRYIAQDYARTPVKPVLDAEPGYEAHMAGFRIENGYLNDYDVRKSAYWAMFSGAAGHSYGCHAVWQMWKAGRRAVNRPVDPWHDSLQLPGANQLRHLRALCERFPFSQTIPDAALLDQPPTSDHAHIAALRDEENRFALFYSPTGDVFTPRLDFLGAHFRASWFDPRHGGEEIVAQSDLDSGRFQPPAWGPDWILLVEKV